MSKTRYDDIVIGSGLSGLVLAAGLKKMASATNSRRRILLLEAGEFTGGAARETHSAAGPANYGLKMMPATDEATAAIQFLESLLEQKIMDGIFESPPLTFSKGQLQPFVGFGEQAPQYVTELAYYTHTQNINLEKSPAQWVQVLKALLNEEIQTNSRVTQFEVDGGKVTGVTVNGGHAVHADRFIFCGSAEEFPTLFATGALPAKLVQKVAQSKTWTSVGLSLVHSQVQTEQDNVHVLYGGTENARPCVGRFDPPVATEGKLLQVSNWLTFLAPEDGTQEELAGTALREIKRQIKRAYPNAMEHLVGERITVNPKSHGQVDLRLEEGGKVPKFENLFVIARGLTPAPNMIGILNQCAETLRVLEPEQLTPEAPEILENPVLV